MHYTGMAAGTFEGAMHYKPGLFALSVLIAVAAATAALWLAMKLIVEKAFFKDNRVKIVSALIMGIAIAGMHFTGMAATVHVTQSTPLPNIQSTLDTRLLALVDDTAAVAPVDEVQALFGWQNLGAIGLTLLLIMGLTLLLIRLLDRSKKDPLAFQFTSAANRRMAVFFNALFIMLVFALNLWALSNIKDRVKGDMRKSLQTVLETTLEAMNIWVRDQKRNIIDIAADPRIVALASGQLAHHNKGDNLLFSPELASLRKIFAEIQGRSGHIGFFVIAPNGVNVASMRDENIGQINLIQKERPDLLRRAFDGETVFIPPIPSDVPLEGALNITGRGRPPTMFFASPIWNASGEVIAVLTERFNPHGDFSRINLLGRIGETGETYTFDRQGRLLSESRFLLHLVSAQLIQSGEQSVLSVEIRDPGGNPLEGYRSTVPRSDQPLTRMAASATRGETGYDVDGYRDYRGVPVIGVWAWNDELMIGMTSEIDVAEAMETFNITKLVIITISAITVLLSISFTVLMIVVGERANRSLRKARGELEDRVQLRTRELSEAKETVELAHKAADAANRAKSSFLATMSHEIRTPMNAIMGFTQLVLKTELSSKQSEFLNTIQISAQNLLTIIDDILDFSKIEAGKLSLESVEFSLESLLGDIAHQKVLKTQNKGLELLFYIDPNVPNILLGDPLRLGQVLLNLLSNAIKFTDRGQVVMTVKTEKSTGADAVLRFAIQDTGIGLSEQQIANLFQPFTQADSSTTREYGGTGLGLSICQRLVELMGGRLWVESEQRKGSIFHFTARFKVIKESNQNYILPPELEGLRILLVDDNPAALNIMKRLLETKSFQVTGCTNPEEALREMEQARQEGRAYDLAILDWRLPKMKGTDLAQKIQQDPNLPEKPKIIIVSASSQEEVEKNTEGGWSGTFLSKPVSASDLFNAILSLFQSQKPEAKPIKKQSIPESDQIKQITGAHILLVEDNLINQELALELLGNVGIQVRVANNGREALEMLQTETFDGVLMDVQMPEMDGLTATYEIRKQKKFKKLPIIAMTANAFAKDRQAVLKVGMNDHIAKPIQEHELFSIMAKWIKPSGLIAQEPAEKSKPHDAEGAPEIPALEGIDVEMGLIIAQDNQALYRRLLGMFRDSERDFVAQFRSAQEDGDANAPEHLAHTLRGVAGNIGARTVQETAFKLETACREGRTAEEIKLRLEAVEQALLPVITSLEKLKEVQGKADGREAVIDAAELKAWLKDLAQLLIRSDTMALDVVEPMPSLVGVEDYRSQLTQLKKRIHDYDFDSALELIRELRGEL